MQRSRKARDNQRRSFLKFSGLLGLGTMASMFLPAEKAEALLFNKKEYKISKTRLGMGTYIAMTAIHPSIDQAEEAFGLAFDVINRLSALLSRHAPGSPISELNRTARLTDAPVEVQEVIARSLYYNRETGGMFDITVKPLIDLYQSSFARNRKPEEHELQEVLALIGSQGLKFAGNSISFTRDNMGVTLDGIAKGYIVDRASEILVAHGIDNHLINAGGDIRTSGTAARGRKWSVAIQDPKKNRDYPEVISMAAGAIATSGNYEVFYDREKIFHHIVDSRSGRSPQLSASVSVMAPTVMQADALSTAVFVFEPQRGTAFINRLPDCQCFVVSQDGAVSKSSGWKS